MMPSSTKEFIDILKKEDELLVITDEVNPHLDLAEIQRQAVAQQSKALLFTNVKGCEFSVATNLYGSEKRIDLAFGKFPERFLKNAVETFETLFPPTFSKLWQAKGLALQALKMGTKNTNNAPLLQSQCKSLKDLPQIQCWPEDGGAFVTLPLVYTESPVNGKSNLGMYRIQLFNDNQCGMHIQIHRGGGFHYHEAETRNESLPVHIYVGGPPALTLGAILPLPENVPEILFASLLKQKRLQKTSRKDLSPLPFLSEADFCIAGTIPPFKRKPEGPFGDHYGYYSLQHDYPYVDVKHIFHRKDAIYPATVVGRPPQEDHYLACYLQDLLKPLIQLTMPQIHEVWAYEESGVHSLAGAIVKDRYPREALGTCLRILGEGQLSLSKMLLTTDHICDVKNIKEFLPRVLERMDFRSDVFVLSNISQDTLDYTGPKVNEGSKLIFLGVGEPKRQLPQEFHATLQNTIFKNPHAFCEGVLAIEGPTYAENQTACELLTQEPALHNWPLVVLVDDAKAATANNANFLWHVFTRFEPAADLYAKSQTLNRYHVEMETPLVLDCRMKPWYPKVLEPTEQTVINVKPILEKYNLI